MPHFDELKWSLLLYIYIFLISHEEQWYTPVIPAFGELNQDDHEFENSLNSIAILSQKQEFWFLIKGKSILILFEFCMQSSTYKIEYVEIILLWIYV